MKIVIISKNILPYNSPRSHRATELAKELARQQHEVVLYAILGNYDYTQFMKDTGIVVKNLGKASMSILDSDGNRNRTFLSKALSYLFVWYLDFPHILLAKKTLRAIRNEASIDFLITIAMPHTIHWGAALAKNKRFYKKWVADCGDPYALSPMMKFPFYFKYIEKCWSRKADFITIPIKDAIDGYFPEFHSKIKVIPQGFNFNEIKLEEYKKNNPIHFAFAGMVYPEHRDPSLFLDYLCTLDDIQFKFVVFTNQHKFYTKYKEVLGDKLIVENYVPRLELLKRLSKMDFLINIKNASGVQQPSKLIDYQLTKRPILEISSNFTEQVEFQEFLNETYINKKELDNLDEYNITNVADQFLKLYYK